MTKIRSPFNYDPADFVGEVNTGESQTVPDQALSIKEIIDFSRSGIDIGLNSNRGLYDDDLGSSDIDDFEPVEVNDIFEAHMQALQVQQELTPKEDDATQATQESSEPSPKLEE